MQQGTRDVLIAREGEEIVIALKKPDDTVTAARRPISKSATRPEISARRPARRIFAGIDLQCRDPRRQKIAIILDDPGKLPFEKGGL